MTRDLARRVQALEAAMPEDLPLRTRNWFSGKLTPAEEARLAAEPDPERQTAAQWDAWSAADRAWFEERDVFRPQS